MKGKKFYNQVNLQIAVAFLSSDRYQPFPKEFSEYISYNKQKILGEVYPLIGLTPQECKDALGNLNRNMRYHLERAIKQTAQEAIKNAKVDNNFSRAYQRDSRLQRVG